MGWISELPVLSYVAELEREEAEWIAAGLDELESYLARQAEFCDWLAEHER